MLISSNENLLPNFSTYSRLPHRPKNAIRETSEWHEEDKNWSLKVFQFAFHERNFFRQKRRKRRRRKALGKLKSRYSSERRRWYDLRQRLARHKAGTREWKSWKMNTKHIWNGVESRNCRLILINIFTNIPMMRVVCFALSLFFMLYHIFSYLWMGAHLSRSEWFLFIHLILPFKSIYKFLHAWSLFDCYDVYDFNIVKFC